MLSFCGNGEEALIKVKHISFSDEHGGAGIACKRISRSLRGVVESSTITPAKVVGGLSFVFSRERYGLLHFAYAVVERLASKLAYPNVDHKVSMNFLGIFSANRLRKMDVDVFHFHWINNCTISLAEIAKINAPVIITMHDEWWYLDGRHYRDITSSYSGGFFSIISRLIKKPYLRYRHGHIQKIIDKHYFTAPSHWLKEQAEAHNPCLKGKISVVPNPIDVNVFLKRGSDCSRQMFGIPSDKKVILFGAQKGGGSLIKGRDIAFLAIESLIKKRAGQDFVVMTFGGGAAGCYVSGGVNVVEVGFVADPVRMSFLYSCADVTLVPSRLEAFGQVAVESISCGTPVIAFRNTGVEDIVIDGETGYLAQPFSFESVADKLDKVFQLSDAGYHDMGVKCRSTAIDKFSESAVSKGFLNTYELLLSEVNT